MIDHDYISLLCVFPTLSSALWPQIAQRFFPASAPYMRKLGVVGKTSVTLPCTTIDNFFQVSTSGPQGYIDRSGAQMVEFQPLARLPPPRLCNPVFTNMCPMCQSVLTNDPRASSVVCMSCGECTSCLFSPGTTAGGASEAQPHSNGVPQTRRVTTYMYKRTNHFLDHLKRVQAKETSSIQPSVVQAVENELRKERILMGDARITTTKVRSILKKLRLQKFYNHVFAITSQLSGRAPPRLTPVQEEKLLAMFQAIQGPFQRHCPPDRTNMISYSYVLRKLVEILGWVHLMDYFPLLKSRQKVYNQDCIWRKICDDVGFPYHRSIA